MSYLAEQLEPRLDPQQVLAGAQSVIMVADRYAGREPDQPMAPGRGRIARYARGRDYHVVIKKRLHSLCDALHEQHPRESFRSFTDTAPVLEREYAARAGLGWIGKHTLMINPRSGSYFLLGGVLTTLDLRPPAAQPIVADHCGTCTRCIDACPTRAITPYSVDASRCIAYLTIERREGIDPSFNASMGSWLFGCDICQEVCPHNSPRPSGLANPVRTEYQPRRDSFDLFGVLGWTEEDRRREFESSPLKRATLTMMKRNTVIAAGNTIAADPRSPNAAALLARLNQIASGVHEPDQVRQAAAGVLAEIGRTGRA
jgi:epoxyqueuosine reductase